ncbi:MAG: glycoside hydrolase family 172 protein [Promethearchaeota archaeon]
MSDNLQASKFDEMIFAKGFQWKVKQVSTHSNEKPLVVHFTQKQWKFMADRGLKHQDYAIIHSQNKFIFPILDGGGCIVNIWFTFSSGLFSLRKYYKSWDIRKKVYLRIFFDNEDTPSVNSPIGDFFGVGFGKYREFKSKYLEETSGGYICRFPMPFKKNARIEIVNTSEKTDIIFYGAITFRHYENGFPYDPFYFHARYREEQPTTLEIPYKLIDVQGEGFYAGCVLNQANIKRKDGLRFLEGNTKFYVDGETFPSLEYTGTEDIFQGAWYYIDGVFSAPYHGCTVHSAWKKAGIFGFLRSSFRKNQISQYRFHENDAIPFKKSLLVFNHHGEFDEILTNQSSVTYFYARKPIQINWDPLQKGDFPDEYYAN